MPRFAFRFLLTVALGGVVLLATFLEPALAQTATPPAPNKGDTAWMLASAVLVLLMTIPGLALFYAGLVRAKNAVSMLTQVFATVCLVAVLWVLYGYSLAFTSGGAANDFVGGLGKAFLMGVTPDSTVATFSNGVVIPELVYICFQLTFACITPALIVGGFAERMKFSALMLFVALWVTFVYFPMAHMVWYWAGPDTIAEAATKLAQATDGAAKDAAKKALDIATGDAGLAFKWGAIDFAGGTVVHINSGIAALVGAILLGKRLGYRAEPMSPHSVTLTCVGAALLWVGWFGFNAGSALEAGGSAALAMTNTFLATAAAALAWLVFEFIFRWKFSLLGLCSGVVAGLVAVTPAAGFSGPIGAVILGAVAGVVCLFFCTVIKWLLRYDDSLDVFGIHCIGGIVGAIGTGLVVNPAWGGTGIADYALKPGTAAIADYAMNAQVMSQLWAVGLTLVWSGVGSLVIFTIVNVLIGARVSPEEEQAGLDTSHHGERAYAYEH
ncbi:MAG TPA: ammonium transporter [Hyphomicrobiaceae bacterium]|jgi:Amt family ammonium transporter|nr:ammonium transporter [Hyphomicrobiaceae bacterium]